MKKARISEFRSYGWIKDDLQDLGWNTKNPNIDINGQVFYQQECLDHQELREHLKNKRPEFVVKLNTLAFWVIEAKSDINDIETAIKEAEEYGNHINKSSVIKAKIVTGVAGTEPDKMVVKNAFLGDDGKYHTILYNNKEKTSLLSVNEAKAVLDSNSNILKDYQPDFSYLQLIAKKINDALYDASINKDERIKVISALILALSIEGDIDLRADDFDVFIESVNSRAKQFLRMHNKIDFFQYIKLKSPEKQNVRNKYRIGLETAIFLLLKANIKAAMKSGTDVLGQFYEAFLKHGNGAKDMGVVFTPRHITKFASEIINITYSDIVYDPTCGTGGFLVSAYDHVKQTCTEEQFEEFRLNKIFGIELDPTIATLAIINMLFRGDGKTYIINDDCTQGILSKHFNKETNCISAKFISNKKVDANYTAPITKVLMNPPFSKKNASEKEYEFVQHALEQMEVGGILFSVLPTSIMIKGGVVKTWRENLLLDNTLLSVVTLPEDLFYPVGIRTVGVFIKKGVPHDYEKNVLWAKVKHDGYTKVKGIRQSSENVENDLAKLHSYLYSFIFANNSIKLTISEFIKICPICKKDLSLELMPEMYLDEKTPDIELIKDEARVYVREYLSFLIKSGTELNLKTPNFQDSITITPPTGYKMMSLDELLNTDDFVNGSVHSITDLQYGSTPIISCKTSDNGIVGNYELPNNEIYNHSYTIAGDGSFPVTTFYHFYPFGAYDNVTICPIKKKLPLYMIFFIASRLNSTRWRYSYGRKCYLNKTKRIELLMPVNVNDEIDEVFISSIFKNTYGWDELNTFINSKI